MALELDLIAADPADTLFLTDAATGHVNTIHAPTGREAGERGVVLAVEAAKPDQDPQRWDFVMTADSAMAMAGMLFQELPAEQRRYLVNAWRRGGYLRGI